MSLLETNIKIIVFGNDTYSYLGGSQPSDLLLPVTGEEAPFIYLGRVSNKDLDFKWLPFSIDLTAPIFLSLDEVYIDYTDPQKPIPLHPDILNQAENQFPHTDQHTLIEYQQKSISFSRDFEKEPIGFINQPVWVQHPNFPTCPVSNESMRFVCQLRTNRELKTVSSNISEEGLKTRYYDHMDFWSYGDLFVFIHPTSRIACYIIQNT